MPLFVFCSLFFPLLSRCFWAFFCSTLAWLQVCLPISSLTVSVSLISIAGSSSNIFFLCFCSCVAVHLWKKSHDHVELQNSNFLLACFYSAILQSSIASWQDDIWGPSRLTALSLCYRKHLVLSSVSAKNTELFFNESVQTQKDLSTFLLFLLSLYSTFPANDTEVLVFFFFKSYFFVSFSNLFLPVSLQLSLFTILSLAHLSQPLPLFNLHHPYKYKCKNYIFPSNYSIPFFPLMIYLSSAFKFFHLPLTSNLGIFSYSLNYAYIGV